VLSSLATDDALVLLKPAAVSADEMFGSAGTVAADA
jgi:hypothetical protein